MPLVPAAEIVARAARGGYAVPAINCQGGNYDIARAVVETAAEESAPVILMAYQANTAYYGLGWLPRLAAHLVGEDFASGPGHTAGPPVAVHLDHGQDVETVKRAIAAGYTSVMIDYSTRPLEENIAAVREVREALDAAPGSVSLEAEIGELQRNDPSGPAAEPRNLVDPEDVRRFVSEVSVDMLAVGIGNAHGFYKGEPNIRTDLLAQVKEIVGDLPLVLHGTTGIPEKTVRECIAGGVAKINFGTIVRVEFVRFVEEALADDAAKGHIWRVLASAKDRIKTRVREIIRLTGSAGRAS